MRPTSMTGSSARGSSGGSTGTGRVVLEVVVELDVVVARTVLDVDVVVDVVGLAVVIVFGAAIVVVVVAVVAVGAVEDEIGGDVTDWLSVTAIATAAGSGRAAPHEVALMSAATTAAVPTLDPQANTLSSCPSSLFRRHGVHHRIIHRDRTAAP